MKRLNPVYKKELKQMARTRRMLVLLLAYNFLLAGLGLLTFYMAFGSNSGNSYSGYGGMLTVYEIILAMEFSMILLIVPAATSGAVSGEREKQTLDILLSTGISPYRIITGKLAASISMMLLLIVSSFPVLAVVFSVGGVTLIDMLQSLVMMVVTAIYIGSIGVLFSVVCKKTTIATVCSYIVMPIVGVMMPILLFFSEIANKIGQTGLYYLSEFGECITGKRAILLLLNPLTTLISMTRDQIGKGITMMEAIGSGSDLLGFLADNWFVASSICQLVVSGVIIAVAAAHLKPKKG